MRTFFLNGRFDSSPKGIHVIRGTKTVWGRSLHVGGVLLERGDKEFSFTGNLLFSIFVRSNLLPIKPKTISMWGYLCSSRSGAEGAFSTPTSFFSSNQCNNSADRELIALVWVYLISVKHELHSARPPRADWPAPTSLGNLFVPP